MKMFAIGLAMGLLLGATTGAIAATVVGDTGYLSGWEVKVGEDTVCSDPYVWTATHEIQCDEQ